MFQSLSIVWILQTFLKIMLQLIVDDADEFAQFASAKGVRLDGPMIENGEKIYSLTAPDGMQVTLHSTAE